MGLIGLGKIGAEMAKVAQAFGMQICAWSHQNLTAERAAACGAAWMPSLHALLNHSDMASIHLVLRERTHHLIDAAALGQNEARRAAD